MDKQTRDTLIHQYRNGLLNDVIPFWLRHSLDPVHEGFMTALDQDGTVIDTDKAIWQQGRFTWLLATLYNTVEPRDEWLAAARSGITFMQRHGFDADGRMFFLVTQDGQPLRKRRYVYSESFAAIAFAAYAKATRSDEASHQAKILFDAFVRYTTTPGLLPPKGVLGTRPGKHIGTPMILINTAQELRANLGDDGYSTIINQCIAEIERDFMKPDLAVVMETVGPNGELINHFDGRMLNPGHAIEAAWFILHEARLRENDPHLVSIGTQVLDWMWKRGWDTEYGGLFYFRDLYNLPVQEYWHDMKFWWPHAEAIIATLLAYVLTGNPKYAKWHQQVNTWAHSHFPDPEHGEWFGYLHRDGRLSTRLKGNVWKGPFHIPRMQWYCWQVLGSS